MITDNYIKMCEKAEEMQKGWKPEEYDIFTYDGTSLFRYPLVKRTKEWMAKHAPIWLPTLEQLFDIWSYLCNTNNKAHPEYLAGDHLPTHFIEEIYSYIKNERNWFDKEMCLEIIMRDFYNKIWTDEKWEAVKEC